MDTKIDSTHAYMLALMLRSSSLAHKLLMPMLMLMLASLVRTGLKRAQESLRLDRKKACRFWDRLHVRSRTEHKPMNAAAY